MIRLDVLVVGGGLQGLLLLEELTANGRSCVLITNSDLGDGQTLHSHGLLNTGFGFAGPGLRETRDRLVLPFLRARGIEPYGEWFLVAPGDTEVGVTLTAANLPAEFDSCGDPVWRMDEFNFPKRRLVESLGRAHPDRIVRGRISEVRGRATIESVLVDLAGSGQKLLFAPSAVIAATGTGTKRFLSSLIDAPDQLAKIRHRRVHILCVKGPAGVLPAINLLSLTHGLNLVAHADQGAVVWYSTPFQMDDPNFEHAPDDAEAEIDPGVVSDGFQRLRRLFPPIAARDDLRFTAYAGYRQDVGETVGTPACELVLGATNILMALPSLVVNAWSNAKAAVEMVDAVAPRRIQQPSIPGAGVRVSVGQAREDRSGVPWKTWRQVCDEGWPSG